MSDPFATALTALHDGPGSVAAIYQDDVSEPREIRVIQDQQTQEASFGETTLLLDGLAFIVRRADVERPAEGNTLLIGDAGYRVSAAPMLDVEGVSWRLEVVRVDL